MSDRLVRGERNRVRGNGDGAGGGNQGVAGRDVDTAADGGPGSTAAGGSGAAAGGSGAAAGGSGAAAGGSGAAAGQGSDAGAGAQAETSGSGPRSSRDPHLRGPWWFTRPRELSEEQRHSLLAQLYFTGPERRHFLGRFTVLLSIALLIAVFGLAEDSPSVVIGAMLVSPMTTPLLGLAAALVMGWPRRQIETILILIGATVGGIALSWLALFLIPEPAALTLASEQLLSHAEPQLLDLGVALVAGAAGAYVLVRREAIGALPGVAIAVALVPPLATTGMMLELGELNKAADALLLYGTNLAGIVLAAAIVLLLSGVRTRKGGISRTTPVGIGAAVVATILVAIPLGEITRKRADDAIAYDDVVELTNEWLDGTDVHMHELEIDEDRVFLELEGPQPPGPLDELADRIARKLERPIELEADWVRARRLGARAEP